MRTTTTYLARFLRDFSWVATLAKYERARVKWDSPVRPGDNSGTILGHKFRSRYYSNNNATSAAWSASAEMGLTRRYYSGFSGGQSAARQHMNRLIREVAARAELGIK